MIVFDENVEQYWIHLFAGKGYDYLSIRDKHGGMYDIEIIKMISDRNCVFITEDKDFGELVFAHNYQNVSIIFLRYEQPQYHTVENNLIESVEKYYSNPVNCFITVTQNKIRVRKL